MFQSVTVRGIKSQTSLSLLCSTSRKWAPEDRRHKWDDCARKGNEKHIYGYRIEIGDCQNVIGGDEKHIYGYGIEIGDCQNVSGGDENRFYDDENEIYGYGNEFCGCGMGLNEGYLKAEDAVLLGEGCGGWWGEGDLII